MRGVTVVNIGGLSRVVEEGRIRAALGGID
jgi:hypothetical protein